MEKLYNICEFFDEHDDDEWKLNEGEHFEWLQRNIGTRRFYESGAMAIAKYLQEQVQSNPISNFLDIVWEQLTHRRKHARKLLVRRRVVMETQDLSGVIVRNGLVFIERPRAG